MSAENARAVLFRTLTDSDFYNLMLVNPDEALKGYDLTDDERRILTTPDKDLYKMLVDSGRLGWGFPPFVIVLPALLEEDDEKIVQLVNSVQNAVGQERFAKIIQLVQKMQKQSQIRSDPPQNE